jgi:hypothetical protein
VEALPPCKDELCSYSHGHPSHSPLWAAGDRFILKCACPGVCQGLGLLSGYSDIIWNRCMHLLVHWGRCYKFLAPSPWKQRKWGLLFTCPICLVGGGCFCFNNSVAPGNCFLSCKASEKVAGLVEPSDPGLCEVCLFSVCYWQQHLFSIS